MNFTKMHGLGNDYVCIDCYAQDVSDPESLAVAISDRHRGVGSDGLILIEPAPANVADVTMRMFNADGSEAEMCGNGIRCVIKYAYEHGHVPVLGNLTWDPPQQWAGDVLGSIQVRTGAGVLTADVFGHGSTVAAVRVNMGEPVLTPSRIPVNIDGESVVSTSFEVADFSGTMTCVSMGNPHAVFFVDDISAIDLGRTGPAIEHHSLFPERVNVHFVTVQGPQEMQMITWERGSGATQACGTGASAVCVAGVLTNQTQRSAVIHLPGGDLELYWREEDNCVYMTGPAEEVFSGTWER